MKKIGVFAVCVALLAALQVFAECNNVEENTCPQTYKSNQCNNFLCTDSDMETIFHETGLSESQICTANKLQEKYELETLSVNDRLMYEENVLNEYIQTCTKNSEIRAQKNKIKDLKKTRKDICKCYERQFKAMLSTPQRKAYNKYRKS